jgi:hypothetical protein
MTYSNYLTLSSKSKGVSDQHYGYPELFETFLLKPISQLSPGLAQTSGLVETSVIAAIRLRCYDISNIK